MPSCEGNFRSRALRIYAEQMKHGRWFMHDHPWTASSLELPAVQKFMQDPPPPSLPPHRVLSTVADQWQFGLLTKGPRRVLFPARKRTRLLMSSLPIEEELQKVCPGTHEHQHLVGGRAEDAHVYAQGLYEAFCRGLRRECHLRDNKLKVIASVNVGT